MRSNYSCTFIIFYGYACSERYNVGFGRFCSLCSGVLHVYVVFVHCCTMFFGRFSSVYWGSGIVRPVEGFGRLASRLGALGEQGEVTMIYTGSTGARCTVTHTLRRKVTRFLVVKSSTVLRGCPALGGCPRLMGAVRIRSPSRTTHRTIHVIHRNKTSVLVGKVVGASGLLRTVLSGRGKLLPGKGMLARLTIVRVPACGGLLFFSSTTIVPHPALRRHVRVV